MNGGMARSNTTARPGSSTSQPMIRSVSGHSFSAEPSMRARLCSPLVTTAAAAPSPNKRGGDHRRRVVAVEADRDRAGLDGDEQPVAAGIGGGELAARRKAVHSAGATEAEYRHAADVIAKADARPDARFEARGGNAGGRDDDDAVDLVRLEARLLDRGRRRLGEHLLAGLEIEGIAFAPAMARQIPVLRRDDVPPRNSGIVEDAGKPVEQRRSAAERFAAEALGVALFDDVRRNRGRE